MGNLYVIATPIGNLSDISYRALEILKSVSLVCCEDTRQTIKIFNHYGIKQKMTSYHKFNENSKKDMIIKKLLDGEDVAIVSDAGTPCISDPGYILVNKAREEGINVYAVPGPSASVSALSVSGLDSKMFSFIGFLSQDNKKRKEELEIIKESKIDTFIIYESPKRIVKLVEELKKVNENAKLFIVNDLTKIHERSFYGNINSVYEKIKIDKNIEKGEYVLVLQKENKKEEKEEIDLSLESLIIDVMVKNKVSQKDAVNILSENGYKKNDLIVASFRLKKLFKE